MALEINKQMIGIRLRYFVWLFNYMIVWNECAQLMSYSDAASTCDLLGSYKSGVVADILGIDTENLDYTKTQLYWVSAHTVRVNLSKPITFEKCVSLKGLGTVKAKRISEISKSFVQDCYQHCSGESFSIRKGSCHCRNDIIVHDGPYCVFKPSLHGINQISNDTRCICNYNVSENTYDSQNGNN